MLKNENDVKHHTFSHSFLCFREDLSELCIVSEYYPVGLSPIDNRTGICRNITNAIHLDVFYAETGRSNGFPIYEVLGSKVR